MQREENWEVPLNVLPKCKCCMLGWTCDKGTNRQTDEQTLGLPFHFIRRWMCYGDRVCGQVRLNIWVWDFEYDVYSCSISLFTLLLIDSDLERLKNAVDTFLETEIVTNQQILTTGDFFPWKKRISNYNVSNSEKKSANLKEWSSFYWKRDYLQNLLAIMNARKGFIYGWKYH